MNITPKQRKALWICVAIVVGCYFARSVVNSAMQMQYYQRQAVLAAQRKSAQVKASPAPAAAPSISLAPAAEPPKATALPADKAAPPADTLTSLPTPAPIPPAAPVASPAPTLPPEPAPIAQTPMPFAAMPGIWHGRAALDRRGMCDLSFELRETDPFTFIGYSFFSCMATPALRAQKDPKTEILNRGNADAARLTGKLEDGVIHLHSNKALGSDINGCKITTLTLTPFGKNQLAAEWQQGTCGTGYMLIKKVAP